MKGRQELVAYSVAASALPRGEGSTKHLYSCIHFIHLSLHYILSLHTELTLPAIDISFIIVTPSLLLCTMLCISRLAPPLALALAPHCHRTLFTHCYHLQQPLVYNCINPVPIMHWLVLTFRRHRHRPGYEHASSPVLQHLSGARAALLYHALTAQSTVFECLHQLTRR